MGDALHKVAGIWFACALVTWFARYQGGMRVNPTFWGQISWQVPFAIACGAGADAILTFLGRRRAGDGLGEALGIAVAVVVYMRGASALVGVGW